MPDTPFRQPDHREVPDLRYPAFRAEAHRQSAAVAGSARAPEDQAFIEALSDRDEE